MCATKLFPASILSADVVDDDDDEDEEEDEDEDDDVMGEDDDVTSMARKLLSWLMRLAFCFCKASHRFL